jgi:hypothetical protein
MNDAWYEVQVSRKAVARSQVQVSRKAVTRRQVQVSRKAVTRRQVQISARRQVQVSHKAVARRQVQVAENLTLTFLNLKDAVLNTDINILHIDMLSSLCWYPN